jgi:hypothetical protein
LLHRWLVNAQLAANLIEAVFADTHALRPKHPA